MAEAEWTRIFLTKINSLNREDSWRLEFDDTLEANNPNPGWQQYIRNTSARFRCSTCRRGWPSNRVKVVFHMHLTGSQGVVKVRRFRQNCKICTEAPMERPNISSDNIGILLENLMEKIRIKCYREDLGTRERPFKSLDVESPHEPDHCEACIQGICSNM